MVATGLETVSVSDFESKGLGIIEGEGGAKSGAIPDTPQSLEALAASLAKLSPEDFRRLATLLNPPKADA